MMDILSMIGSLALIILVLVFTYYATRWYARRMGQSGQGKYMKLIDRTQLGTGACVAIVRIDKKYYLLGVGDKSVRLICELPDFEEDSGPEPAEQPPFSQIFRQMADKVRDGMRGKDGDGRS